MTDDPQRGSQDTRDDAAQDTTAGPAGDALRGAREDLSPEHDQPVEGGVEQAEDGTGATTAG